MSIIANLVVDPQSRKLLAADAWACEYFSLGTNDLDKVKLHDLIPELDQKQWDALYDQNDNRAHLGSNLIVSKLIGAGDSTAVAEIRGVPLLGFKHGSVLLSISIRSPSGVAEVHLDALTGLPDRRELQLRYQALQHECEGQVAVVFMDLDQFKEVNDELGHAMGDRVLVALAERWKNCVRGDDLVVRYGGDEFVILLAGVDSREAAQPILDRVSAAAREGILEGEHRIQVGVTLGLAISNSPADSLDQLLLVADQDMYAVKKSKQ